MLKSFFSKFLCYVESYGYARAASALAREGKYEEAKMVILARRDCQ